MKIYTFWALCLGCLTGTRFSKADPCNWNNGGCDRINGLCWGTGETTHFCTCKAGYERDRSSFRHTCININECRNNPCGENARCVDTVGSYRCECGCGYVQDYTRQHCLDATMVTDMCVLPRQCTRRDWRSDTREYSTQYSAYYDPDYSTLQYAFFPDSLFSTCKCEAGFTKNQCGYCIDRNECDDYPCSGRHSRCVNTEGSFYCECDNGYILDPCRRQCHPPRTDFPDPCVTPNLDSLNNADFTYNTYVEPIVMRNYRNCEDFKRPGDTTIEKYDLNNDGINDVILTWVCTENTGGRSTSILKSFSEEEPRWDAWSCWTGCKATCWGGLQTRVRVCLNGLPGSEGCEGEGSQKRDCYTGPKCSYRIRKDVTTLSEDEVDDLMQAMRKYKADETATGFHNAAAAHGWPFQCDRQSCCPHGDKMKFLAWHRSIILNYEEGLNRYMRNKSLGIPYWNWLRNDRAPPGFAWDRFNRGRENPFSNMTVLIDRTGPMRTIQRDSTVFMDALNFAEETWRTLAVPKIATHILHEFADSLESSHGGPHVSACGGGRLSSKCTISLARLDYAGFDPLFMLHHSQVDRLWAIAQNNIERSGSTTWSMQTGLEVLDERGDFGRKHMPFGNLSLNPFPLVQAVNTMTDSFYQKELTGVIYDDLARNGYPPTLSRTGLRAIGDEALYIGQYFQSDTQNFKVNYYRDDGRTPCSRMTSRERLGGTIRLGTSNFFRQNIPHLVRIVEDSSGVDIDLNVKACYTANLDCEESCPDRRTSAIAQMPTPHLVYYMPNTPVDIYKFNWANGQRMPSWYINLHSTSQWIYFYGDRRNDIYQVRSGREYVNCDRRRGRRFRCALPDQSACIMPSGIYFLIDGNASNCRRGLKMVVVSRK